jgi:hypothetical protein
LHMKVMVCSLSWVSYIKIIDGYVCVFPWCKNLLCSHKCTGHASFVSFNSRSTTDFTWYLSSLAITGPFIPILIPNINSSYNEKHVFVCVCVTEC